MPRSAILREIQLIHHEANAALMSQSIPDVLERVAEAVARLLPADRISIIGFNVDKAALDYFVVGGAGRKDVALVTYEELGEGLSGWALREGEPALSAKGELDPRESTEAQRRRAATNCGSVLVVPIRNHETSLGTITAINRPDQGDFQEADVETLLTVSMSVGLLIENAKLMADLQLSRDVAEAFREVSVEQSALKDKLFTILAHDLRGPVGSLKALLDVAAESSLSPEDLLEVVSTARKSAGQTYDLLDNVLGWVRSQIEEVKVLRGRFVLEKNLRQVVAWLDAQAQAKDIRFVLECPETLTVSGDERMVETIVRNLASNAVKYSFPGSPVLIRAFAREDAVVVEVVDSGAGVPPDKIKRLFARHVDSQRGTTGEAGNGLGLMFCSDLAQALEGRLEAESVGRGSTFRLILPDPVETNLVLE